jgi:alkylation response protein AidB-like acyl-CoA dehydrogenase
MSAPPTAPLVTDLDAPAFDALCSALAIHADALDLAAMSGDTWPAEQLKLCAQAGAVGWYVPREHGGHGWSEVDCVRAYIKLSAACLTTTFVLTQPIGMARRLVVCDNVPLRERLLPELLAGRLFGAIGIAQLTTSRRHVGTPVLAARETPGGFVLDGMIPWVTGNRAAGAIVSGATLDDGREILFVLPTNLPGVRPDAPLRLTGLSATQTGMVRCVGVRLERDWLLAGPVENVLASVGGAGTGGLQTSALAVGLTTAAVRFLGREAERRPELAAAHAGLASERDTIERDLLELAAGHEVCLTQDLRTRANSLVLRATQAALAAAKGSGYAVGHPTGRWCREALFFLVWSCPQPVMAANLCELAGLS